MGPVPRRKPSAKVLEIQRLQGETGIRPAVTRLTEDQLHEAEAVFRRLTSQPRPLSFYVEFALANYREPTTQKLLTDAGSRMTSPRSSMNTSRTCCPNRT